MSGSPYFVDHKRGEVNELKALLRNQRVERDPQKKREVMKKVIAYMTLGIDVSKVFSEMVMAASTKDLVQKKMVYHYLSAYAHQKANLALLAINTLQKDCADEDPMVRGLALRSLTSLRLPNLLEYAMLPVRKGLNDPSAYVRKTAVLGVAKLCRIFPSQIRESDLVDVLYNMLRDKDATVITNAICALNEILAAEGQMAINQAIIVHLLKRIRDFHEWGQCVVLELVARYTPASQGEMFDVMNLLEDRLRHSNAAMVLQVAKIFLQFTKAQPKLHEEVCKRLKSPLLTLVGSGSVELAFTVLSHIKLLVEASPGVYDDQFKLFFCRFNDPPSVKKLKIDILRLVAADKTYSEIINELSEYVSDVDVEIARAAVRGIARIALRLDAAADEAISHLLSFLELGLDYTSAEACTALKDLLRKYPERYEDILAALPKVVKTVEDPQGRCALLWILGEFGESVSQAPYILEPLIDAFAEEPSSLVRNELLTTAMKLFFKRPPEVKAMLGRLITAAIADQSRVDVRERALLYYRLLAADVHEAARVVNCPKMIVDSFVEAQDQESKDLILSEFNTLSVTYGLPSERFIDTKRNKDPALQLGEDFNKPEQPEAGEETDERSDKGESLSAKGSMPGAATGATGSTASEAPRTGTVDLLSMGDLLGDISVSAPGPAPAAAAPKLALQRQPRIDKAVFQQRWTSLPDAAVIELVVRDPRVTAPQIPQLLLSRSVAMLAQGVIGGTSHKFYFFAQEESSAYFLVECVVDLNTGRLKATVRTDSAMAASATPEFVALFQDAVAPVRHR